MREDPSTRQSPAVLPGQVWVIEHDSDAALSSVDRDALTSANVVLYDRALAPLLAIIRSVRQIAGEDDEVGLVGEAVHRGHSLLERVLGVGIGGALEAPMGVGKLHEMEVAGGLRGGLASGEQPGGKGDAGDAGQLEEVATVGMLHGDPPDELQAIPAAIALYSRGIKSTASR